MTEISRNPEFEKILSTRIRSHWPYSVFVENRPVEEHIEMDVWIRDNCEKGQFRTEGTQAGVYYRFKNEKTAIIFALKFK